MVTYDGEDVTSQAAITNVTTGEPVENAAWTTTEIGEYKFQAVYDSYTSDPVTVSAIDKNKDKEFYRYVLLLKFTYMTCGNCVTAQGYFDALDEADRDHFLVVAAHQPEGMPMDPYWCSEGISLKSKMKVGVYSTWSYNFEDLVVGIGAGAISKTSIRQQISHAEKTYPAVCGVKATSTLEGSTAKIEATVQFQQAGNYKIACVLVENNIENKETYNTFNHVLRAAQTDMEGDAVTPAVTCLLYTSDAADGLVGSEMCIRDSRYAGRNCSGGAYVQFRGDDRGGLECRELRLRGLCIQRGGQWQVYCQ